MNLDLISATVTAPGAGPTAMAAVAGDALVIRNNRPGGLVACIAAWCSAQAVGFVQVMWPSGHDLVRNERVRIDNAAVNNVIPLGFPWKFRPQDPITISKSGSAVAGDVETFHMLMFYDDLPGVGGRQITSEEVRRRGVTSMSVDGSLTATAASTYSNPLAINALTTGADLFKANTDYALLGMSAGVLGGAVSLRGPDTGGMRVGIPTPIGVGKELTTSFFMLLSDAHNLPCVPVINSANRAGTIVEVVQNENLAAVTFSLLFAELAPTA